jgi:hypothetical protein
MEIFDHCVDELTLVNSFNAWHKDTKIESVFGKSTVLPDKLTLKLQYEVHGNLSRHA